MIDETLTLILAGGEGVRLSPLTNERAKPAVPFGGKYRIIDFTLANCLHSGLRRILVLTQYKSHSLQKHLRDGWSIFNPELGEYITAVPPQMRTGDNWYSGTADAIHQNLYLLERSGAKYVVILSGDHIYRMDYAAMIEQHVNTGAKLTVGCMEVNACDASMFGVLELDKSGKVHSFIEKPENYQAADPASDKAMVSMGIYVFSMDLLLDVLKQDYVDTESSHDFGNDIIPNLVKNDSVYGHEFGGSSGRVSQDCYWRDVGTLDAYYEANMDLLKSIPPIDLYQEDWTIRTYQQQLPPARTVPGMLGNEGIFINSIVAGGTIIAGGSVQDSILFARVYVGDEAVITHSVLFEGVRVGDGAQLKNCIIDKNVEIPANIQIGLDPEEDAKRFTISEKGIIVIPKGYVFT